MEKRSVLPLVGDTAPGNLPWHGMEAPRQYLLRRRVLKPVSMTTMSFGHPGMMLSPGTCPEAAAMN